jgi:phospholipid/cholesterol/gamma-HCH transport system ATP-binding protein
MNAVEIIGVDKRFGPHVVYQGLDLTVARGETMTVLGPSGSGKSVLLRLIVGLHKPERGRVLIEGRDVVTLDERALREVRRKIGIVFQGGALFDSLVVGENVAYGLREHFRMTETEVRARVAECLEAVGMPGVARMRPAALSGGMRKRVALARALATRPEMILYDEPTTGLDPANARRINELIVSLKQRFGVTSIVITHEMSSALAVSDRLALVKDRCIPLMVTVEEAQRAPPPDLAAFVSGEMEAA